MKFSKILLVIGLSLSITSCSTTEKFNVYAPKGTKIYTPNNTVSPRGVTTYSDKVNIEVPSDMYCGYMLIQPAESSIKIPIGIDYKINKHTGTKATLYTGGTLASIGVGVTMIGCIAMVAAAAQGDDDNTSLFGMMTGVGGATAGIGAALGAPSQARLRQTAYDYNFGYEKNQRISIPNLSFSLLNPNPSKSRINEPSKSIEPSTRKKATSGKDVIPEVSQSSSKASASRSDNARKIEGNYNGNGSLLIGTSVDENYSEISVILERVDKNHVKVRIIESDEDYFDAPLIYNIQKGKNGIFILKIENLPEATIQINPNGKMTFTHKKVNIENKIYTLKIDATKE